MFLPLIFSWLLLPSVTICPHSHTTPSCLPEVHVQQVASNSPSLSVEHDILSKTVYQPSDSLQVVTLLKKDTGRDDVLFYARQFKGIPYVAHTLEIADPERLVVNLRQLDCTTLVETVLALTMTKRQNSVSFADYCKNLMKLRYWNGCMDGYLSRLHYFAWWMHDNIEKEIVTDIQDSKYFTSEIVVRNYYMSRHSQQYKFLRNHPARVDSIAKLERKYNGPSGHYLPAQSTGLSANLLSSVHDGDIIAIVTRKAGLDYSHLGFAAWGRDGKLHLLNASSIHHKVVEEPKTLRQYLREHPSSIGIRVLRLR